MTTDKIEQINKIADALFKGKHYINYFGPKPRFQDEEKHGYLSKLEVRTTADQYVETVSRETKERPTTEENLTFFLDHYKAKLNKLEAEVLERYQELASLSRDIHNASPTSQE